MRQILGFTMALILWSPAKSYAAEGSVPQQLEQMRKQVAALQREVALLKSALQISDAAACTLRRGATKGKRLEGIQ